jgi:hypothetical protein
MPRLLTRLKTIDRDYGATKKEKPTEEGRRMSYLYTAELE